MMCPVKTEAKFLCARLREIERSILDDELGRDFCGHVLPSLRRMELLLRREAVAIAAATGTAKTAKPVECEASQSGGKAASPNNPLPSSTLDMD